MIDLREVRNPDGSKRFHPPGKHPAGRKVRETRDELLKWLNRSGPWNPGYADAWEGFCYCEQQLANLEAGEVAAKRRYFEAAVTAMAA